MFIDCAGCVCFVRRVLRNQNYALIKIDWVNVDASLLVILSVVGSASVSSAELVHGLGIRITVDSPR
jgi:hypothetical protein